MNSLLTETGEFDETVCAITNTRSLSLNVFVWDAVYIVPISQRTGKDDFSRATRQENGNFFYLLENNKFFLEKISKFRKQVYLS